MISNFPHLTSKPFSIEITPLSNVDTLTNDPSDTMVIRITDKNLSERDKYLFYYGSQDSIDSEIKGEYMDILLWEKNKNKITLSIMFKLICHDMFIELFTFSESDKSQRRKIMKDLNLAKNILRQRIDLFNPAKLNLSINSLNNNINNTNLIFPGDRVVATCRAYDGFPINHEPIFTIPDQLNVTETVYDEDNFEWKIYFFVSINNHLQKLTCKSGNTSQSIIIYILHDPTSIFVDPEIDKLVEPNTRLTCFVKDGYPAPEITWKIMNGSENAFMYFNVISNGSQLHIKSNCPVKSSWTIKCSVKGYSKITERLISFNIAAHPSQLHVEPEIKKWLLSNSTIACFIKEENLNAEIKWQLVKGPTNASFYYDILKGGSEIYMNTNNLPGTMWTFRCNAKIVLTTTKTLDKTISFIIAKNFMKRCDEKCIYAKLLELEDSIERNKELNQGQILYVVERIIGIFQQFNETISQNNEEIKVLKSEIQAKKKPVLLSLNKPTKQSSDYSHNGKYMTSNYAVDGNYSQILDRNIHTKCSHTKFDENAFWMVDLERYYAISHIVIYNRMDCCRSRLFGAIIEVLSRKDKVIEECERILDFQNVYTIKCFSIVGQKIRIRLDKINFLTLCEVEVFGLS